MKKKHVHKWQISSVAGAHCISACCEATLSEAEVHRILNAWERRPKYRKVGTFDTLTDDRKAYMMVQDEYLYVKVSR